MLQYIDAVSLREEITYKTPFQSSHAIIIVIIQSLTNRIIFGQLQQSSHYHKYSDTCKDLTLSTFLFFL